MVAGSPGRKTGDAETSQLARCTGRLQRKGRQKEREKESTAEFVTWGREGGVMEPMGVILGALSRQGRCCGDKVWGVLPPPFPAPPLR